MLSVLTAGSSALAVTFSSAQSTVRLLNLLPQKMSRMPFRHYLRALTSVALGVLRLYSLDTLLCPSPISSFFSPKTPQHFFTSPSPLLYILLNILHWLLSLPLPCTLFPAKVCADNCTTSSVPPQPSSLAQCAWRKGPSSPAAQPVCFFRSPSAQARGSSGSAPSFSTVFHILRGRQSYQLYFLTRSQRSLKVYLATRQPDSLTAGTCITVLSDNFVLFLLVKRPIKVMRFVCTTVVQAAQRAVMHVPLVAQATQTMLNLHVLNA